MNSILTGPRVINNRTLFDYEIIFIKEGKCNITYDNTNYVAQKNQVIFIRPGITHKIEIAENVKFFQPHIHFDAIYNINSEITTVSFKPRDIMTQDELNLIQQDIFYQTDIPVIFTPENIQKFEKTFFKIIDLFSERKNNYELLYKGKMLELISIILEQFETKKSTETTFAHNSVTAAKEYIDNNFTFNITLDSLSEQLYINKFTLMRNFKARYGINIIEYYRKKRIEYAKKLLTDTNYSIYSIGEMLDFSDIYSFSRFFKSQVNMSPNSYRKNNK